MDGFFSKVNQKGKLRWRPMPEAAHSDFTILLDKFLKNPSKN